MFISINGGNLPIAQTKYSAGYDVFSNEDVEILARSTRVIGLGVKIDLDYIKKQFLQDGFDEFDEIDLAQETHPQEYKSWFNSLDIKNDFFEFEVFDEEENEYYYHCINYNGNRYDDFLKSHYLGLYLRSSLGAKGLILPNGVGIIDMDYPDEIKIIIYNPTSKVFQVKKGDRIGQIIIHKHYGSDVLGDNFRSLKDRRGGLGSTNEEIVCKQKKWV